LETLLGGEKILAGQGKTKSPAAAMIDGHGKPCPYGAFLLFLISHF
jgi:hypothetical protein